MKNLSGLFNKNKSIFEFLIVALLGGFVAIIYKVLIFPNAFIPIGLDGICYVLQELTQIDVGYWFIALNLPIILIAFILMEPKGLLRAICYLASFSAFSLILSFLDYYPKFYTGDWVSLTFSPILAGLFFGFFNYLLVRLKTLYGGIEVFKAMSKKCLPKFKFSIIATVFNVLVTIGTIFIFGLNIIPILYSLTYLIVVSITTNFCNKYF